MGVISLISLHSARQWKMQERMWRKNVQPVSDDLDRSANPCNRATPSSSGRHETWMAMQIPAFILELIDSLQSCWARSITFSGSLKSLSPPFILFQIRYALLEKCLQLRDVGLSFRQLLKQSCLCCYSSNAALRGCMFFAKA